MRAHAGLAERLAAAYGIEVDPMTAEQHLAAVGAALRSPPSARRVVLLRGRLGVAFATIALLALPAVAVAAEDSLPGDLLYPVKQATERVRGLADDDVVATHRVEELEALIERGAPLDELAAAMDRARVAVDELAEPGPLSARLEHVRSRIRTQGNADQGTSPVPAGPGSDPGGPSDGGQPGGRHGSGADAGASGAGREP